MHDPVPGHTEMLAATVLDAAFKVHRELGPGLLEAVYERCLCYELRKAGIAFERQISLPIYYDDHAMEAGLQLDVFVEKMFIVELKAVQSILPVHEAQLFTYLKLTNSRLGLLINFNVPLLKDGIKRIVR